MTDKPAGGNPQIRTAQSNLIAFLLSLVVLIVGLNAVDFDYTGPGRASLPPVCTRQSCWYYANGNGYGCHYSQAAGSGGSCPPVGDIAWVFNDPATCGGLDCSWMSCSYGGPVDCPDPNANCSCYNPSEPPATVSGPSYNCSQLMHGIWCPGTATVSIHADEPISPNVITSVESSLGVLCGGLGSASVDCLWTLPEGHSSFLYWAHSSYGDTSGQGSVDYYVDSVDPVLLDFFTPGATGLRGWYQGGSVTLTCTASDLTSGLSGPIAFTGGSPITGGVQATLDRVDTLTCTVSDNAGHTVTASHPANIDSVPPDIQILYNGNPDPGGWGGLVHITATATDATSGVYAYGFTVNGGPLLTDTTLGDGYYEIAGYAEDVAGNITRTNEIVGVDTTAPSTAWNAAPDWVRGTVTLTGHSDDAGSGVAAVYISFNGTDWIRVGSDPDWSYTWDTTQYADQQYMIEARAVDVAGNEEHTAYLVVGVDNTNPLVDLSPEWTAPSAGSAGGSDNLSGIDRARVTITGHGIAPWVQDYGTVPGSVDWNGLDGNGVQAGYGDYDVMLEVWDRAGNYSVTYGVIHLLAPPPPPAPTEALPVVVAPTAMPTAAPVIEVVIPKPELPKTLPFWLLMLPLIALGVWLTASNIALSRDKRWQEIRALRQQFSSYRNQNKTNFSQEGDHD